ncbi:DUF6691 family protein [Hahella sp. SMD15-11]|uniref:DUF6691 family protein n=1 Tax=Thermohahella caldifontis TaxID=3142973 RepID=A0AB39UVE4_9GAMM
MKTASLFVILLGGMLFGAGLALSRMIQPEVVLAFLRFEDMGLLLVLGAAVTTTFVVYQIATRFMRKPVLEPRFSGRPEVSRKDTLTGAALFGVGWGLSGVCPGPAIAGLGAGNWALLVSVLGLLAGAWLHGWWMSRRGG